MSNENDKKKERYITESGLVPLVNDRRIKITPEYLVSHLRDWTESDVAPAIVERLIPFLEHKAIRAKDAAGARVMAAATRTKEAIQAGEAERAAAYCALMICEALMGAYVPDSERTQMELMDLKWSKRQAHDRGIGKHSDDLEAARVASVALAKKIWDKHPALRIGEVAALICKTLKSRKDKFSPGFDIPGDAAVKTWLRDAATKGDLSIPEGAQARGRPRKS